VLARLQRRVPVTVTADDGPFHQEELTAGLVDAARAGGATWIVPIDADELWWAQRPLGEILASAPADVLRCAHVNFVQDRGVRRARPRALLSMTHRAEPRGDFASRRRLVEEGRIALVERVPPAKHLFRALEGLRITAGSHGFTGVPATVADCPDLECLHAPLIARAALASELAARRVARRRRRTPPGDRRPAPGRRRATVGALTGGAGARPPRAPLVLSAASRRSAVVGALAHAPAPLVGEPVVRAHVVGPDRPVHEREAHAGIEHPAGEVPIGRDPGMPLGP
jgi:hypothetical protein